MSSCPGCGESNPDRAKFCLECGAALGLTPSSAEERKVVSVLFCDLVGFTARSAALDPEDVRARIQPYHRRLRQEIERHGGTVEKFIGDAVAAVFGAPIAHEDDAERAVRAGLRIVEAIEDLNASDPRLDLRVRVGIHTGVVLVALGAAQGRGEGIVFGDVVNTASRLETSAPVNAVVVGEPTFRATRGRFDYEELEPAVVKGKAEPVSRWRAIAVEPRFGAAARRSTRSTMIGRDPEKGLLEGVWRRAVANESVQLVTLLGEPGVGKSRLVEEFCSFVERGTQSATWQVGRCPSYGDGITYWALSEIIAGYAGILESDSPDDAARKLNAAIPAGEADREWIKARVAPLVGMDSGAPAARAELFTAWRRLLEAQAAAQPAVLVFEDLHWANEALLAFLDHLVSWSRDVPMLLICTARPELYDRFPLWAGGKRNATTMNLSPLSGKETAKLVSAVLGATVLPAAVHELVLERAGGNPLYAEEFARALLDGGLLVRTGASHALREGAELVVAENVESLIAARLDTLSPDRKALLQDASVLGNAFGAGSLSHMSGRDQDLVRDDLNELARREFLRPVVGSSVGGDVEYVFSHALVRDAAYAQMARPARAARHRTAAEWLERRAGERTDEVAEVLAYHYVQALGLVRIVGESGDAERLEAQARRFLLRAGERALGLDVAAAEASYAQALELTSREHPDYPHVLGGWANAAQQMGRLNEAAAALEESISLLRQRGDSVAAGRAMTAFSGVLRRIGSTRSERVLAEALTLLESEPPGPELVGVYVEQAVEHWYKGVQPGAVEWGNRALRLATELELEPPARALGFRGYARCYLGDSAGLEDMRRALELCAEQNRGRDAAVLHNNLAMALWPTEGPREALDACRSGVNFCERRGIDEWAVGIAASSLDLHIDLGDWDSAVALAESLLTRAEDSGLRIDLIEVRAAMARVFAYRGDGQRAAKHATNLVSEARESGDAEAIARACGAAALVELERRGNEQARALLAELERTLGARETPFYIAFLPELVRTGIACGDIRLAARFLDDVQPVTARHHHAIHAARAALAEAAGNHRCAAELYFKAEEQWHALGVVAEQAHALFGLGRCLLAAGESGGNKNLSEARELFARLGARPRVLEIDALHGYAAVHA